MTRQTIARKRRKAPNPIQGIEIALGDAGGAKRAHPPRTWRHARSARTRTIFRLLFATPPERRPDGQKK